MIRLIPVTVITLLAWHCCNALADVRDDLHGINQKIRENRTQLNKNRKIEKQVSGELAQIEKNLKEKERHLNGLGQELGKVEQTLGKTGKDISLATAEAEKKRQQIRLRLLSLYKAGELGSARIFFSSGSFPQLLENQRYLQGVLQWDTRLFGEYKEKLENLRGLKGTLEKDLQRKEKLMAGIASKKAEIEAEKSKKANYLSTVREKSRIQQASIKELQANAHRLQAMIERLEANSRKSYNLKSDKKQTIGDQEPLPPVADKGFAAQRGRLAPPVRGEIIGRFGRHKLQEFNSYTVSNGISIAAPQGTDIRSVFDGQVIFASYFKGYGNMIIIDHGGGYFSLYGHASKLTRKVGSKVGRNDVIAQVGDQDSTRGPMLYFELRHQGKPIDPTPWLH